MRNGMWFSGLAVAALAIAVPFERAAADPRIIKADQLFAEGKALFGTNLAQACDKFEESLRYNPAAIGTLLNVALCDEKLGRIASAVAKFTEARDRAMEQGLVQHVRAAQQHIVALEADVPHLSIKLTEQRPETRVLIGDRVIPLDEIGNIAVDPGEVIVTVSAPARLPYHTKLIMERTEHREILVPALARSITVASSRRRIGQITTFAGGAAVGTAIGLGLYARHLYHAQFGHAMPGDGRCNDDLECERDGLTRTQRARTLANVATVVGVAGLAVAGVGAYIWVRAPSRAPADAGDRKLTVVPTVAPDGVGVAALGRF
jgi:hypothetical protein